MTALLTIALILVVYSAVSGPLDRRGVTSAMVFVAVGVVLGAKGFGLLDVPLESAVAERVTELALVFLLFGDAARLDLTTLRRALSWPSRLLLIGLPLTMLAGFGVGLLMFPGIEVASAFVLATMLCSTDAALGQRVVDDPAVPERVRQALDVESGLNDGLAVPFFLVALDISLATLSGGVPSAVVSEAAKQIGWGLTAGIGAGIVGGLLLRFATRRDTMQPQWRQVFTFAVALSAYAAAIELGGSAFIAAFVAGMTFGRVSTEREVRSTYLVEETGSFLAAVTWMGFGAIGISKALPHVTWQVVVYAVLSLTVVRMAPVAVAMVHSGARRQTVAFVGWFGPRGLASVVFGLLAIEDGVPDADILLTTVVVTVTLSVVLHGLTSVPLVAAYHRWYDARTDTHPGAVESTPARMSRRRRNLGTEGTAGSATG